MAVSENREAAVKLLLSRGATRDIKDARGETPLDIATRQRFAAIAALLSEPGLKH
jgi:ankyrin repeat protein